ncbi:MAG: 4-hydroxy-3-methylbut-2-enyl diphosphate reductase [Rhodospirillales bacterium]|nr:4-hydroxy-3-methylbut-2-enyl diphosphate reductase [Rhodospirillales bacterium]MCY4004527.1 4-hydroxy-3-methylbut-2-enyl diphosphate reductase [Rhodospirillales bacterium]MCY4098284.1 4-hydroxy-3-methylbut-2-enyl diphosphate reductase [Rhodospirillales bacterium]MXX23328.1 4-hydroxy-3-methylbut-2-enyl diphosphate reductase [Rhodospirillales bacterium]MYE19454.1 4-hydroxy-3-methylbut-2-enyl diphosphate reductase [Rhodospirillales bacterium]
MKRILLANPRGFCAGVERAIEVVERAIDLYGPPVYVRHAIVHNEHVVATLRDQGVVFVDEVDEIPVGAIAVFSAHGVASSVENAAGVRSLRVIDATCPLVSKVHKEAVRYHEAGYEVLLVGHRGHPEVVGTTGRVKSGIFVLETVADVEAFTPRDPERLAYVTQTTLSMDDTREMIDALQARFPTIRGPDLRDICYATRNRQQAVRILAEQSDLIIVVGGSMSSNSARLREIGEQADVPSYRVKSADDLETSWFDGVSTVGVTAGASTPDVLVDTVVERIQAIAGRTVAVQELEAKPENTRFRLPKHWPEAETPQHPA